MAERDLRKMDNEWPEEHDPGFPVPIEMIEDCFIPYHDHRILPHAGGWYDQDFYLTQALREMEYRVAWWIQNLQRPDLAKLPNMEEQAARRRAALKCDGSDSTD